MNRKIASAIISLSIATLSAASAFAESDSPNSVDCSIGATDARFDRIVLTANDETGVVAGQTYKSGRKAEQFTMKSDDYVLLDQNDLKKNPQQAAMVKEIARRVNASVPSTELFVRFNISGDNFFALKFVGSGRAPIAALTVLGHTYTCR